MAGGTEKGRHDPAGRPPNTGGSPAFLDGIDLALLVTYGSAWLAAIVALAA